MRHRHDEYSEGEQEQAAHSPELLPSISRRHTGHQGDTSDEVTGQNNDESRQHQTIFRLWVVSAVGGE
ncbi:MAG: hypothetical protein JNM40_18435 [Myxococcales bacterium]|nr:hypothetical protein [Myxococcales bacterium]